MAFLRSFGAYLPERVVPNSEIAARIQKTAEWIEEVSGIHERRWAAADFLVPDLAVAAAQDCLAKAGLASSDVGMIIVSSGSSERRFPGPASTVGQRLGVPGVPCLDVPIASAGSLFAMSLASRVADVYGNVLVIAAEKMSAVVDREPMDPSTGILFGDGAGACLVSAETGRLRIVDSVLHSDGAYAEDLKLSFEAGLQMNGMPVIMQASRKMPAAINEILTKHSIQPETIDRFVMHQANQNLIVRVAKSVGVPADRFYTNIAKYGNTSSASMLIAASECWMEPKSICFATFGAGFHWGALLAVEAA